MIAYKGVTKEMTAALGKGFRFAPGMTVEEKECKTVRSGFHCAEDPFACLTYYPLGSGNRYFQVKAEGNIDEDDGDRIACTKLSFLKELTVKELAGHGMMYMVRHPMREKWQHEGYMLCVGKDRKSAERRGAIAIARGPHPIVKGAAGSILGLILEPVPGVITAARLFEAGVDTKAGCWYTVDENGKLEEVPHEEKED